MLVQASVLTGRLSGLHCGPTNLYSPRWQKSAESTRLHRREGGGSGWNDKEWGRRRGEDGESVIITTFTCAQETRLLKEIRLRPEIGEDVDTHRSSSDTVETNIIMQLIGCHIPHQSLSRMREPRMSYFNLIRDTYSTAAEFLAFGLILQREIWLWSVRQHRLHLATHTNCFWNQASSETWRLWCYILPYRMRWVLQMRNSLNPVQLQKKARRIRNEPHCLLKLKT